MKKTSHTTKKHTRRRPILGLTPEDVVKQMTEEARGKDVRKVRGGDSEKKPVLSEARTRGSGGGGKKRLPATATDNDSERPGEGGESSVPDSPRDGDGTQISRVLKRMLGEAPPTELMDLDGIGKVATNGEALAAVIMAAALAGKQWAVEMVRDQTEGKPVRAAQMNNSDNEVEDMLDRVSQARLNNIAKRK